MIGTHLEALHWPCLSEDDPCQPLMYTEKFSS